MQHRIAKLSLLTLGAALCALGCHSKPSTEPSASAVPSDAKPVAEVTVDQVQQFIAQKRATVYDANDADTRKKYGVVPSALLLSGHKDYPLSVLPAKKTSKLVFYCGGTQCRASDKAAERAAAAGYNDVNVMRAGIRGWKDAGLPTDPAPQS